MRSKNIDELRQANEGFLNNQNLWIPELDSSGNLILERLLIDYYIDFYEYVSKYNYTKADLLNLQIGILEDYFVDYTKQDQYLIPFTNELFLIFVLL